ncbi:hypothetical protein GCM10023063_24330 [Arthrobacter methylotrophus]|uniref:hypothetical protein n=1 Tax=Arthrobacter methylotrophus TaxID=121291 RepID=UPI0031E66848
MEAGQEIRDAVPDAHGQLDTPTSGSSKAGSTSVRASSGSRPSASMTQTIGLSGYSLGFRYVTYRAAIALPGTGSNGFPYVKWL